MCGYYITLDTSLVLARLSDSGAGVIQILLKRDLDDDIQWSHNHAHLSIPLSPIPHPLTLSLPHFLVLFPLSHFLSIHLITHLYIWTR